MLLAEEKIIPLYPHPPTMKKTLIRAGGGTGGHVFPIKSMIQYLQTSPDQLKHYRLGSKESLEEEVAAQLINQDKIKNLTFLPIFSGKLRRQKTLKALFQNFLDMFRFIAGIFQALYYLIKLKAEVVFCKGGYVALPTVLAAWVLRKKILVHESDVHPGLVNRIASKFADKVFTGFDQVLPWAETLGQIISDDILYTPTAQEKTQRLSSPTKVLVMGGSQGAQTLYQQLAQSLSEHPELQSLDFTLILGKLNQDLQPLFASFPNVVCRDFASQKELGKLYFESDIALTRAGTTSLAEQRLYQLKLLMVPLPWTHDQLDNAKWYVQQHEAILIRQDKADFWPQLSSALLSLRSYKKPNFGRAHKQQITHAKARIAEHLLS